MAAGIGPSTAPTGLTADSKSAFESNSSPIGGIGRLAAASRAKHITMDKPIHESSTIAMHASAATPVPHALRKPESKDVMLRSFNLLAGGDLQELTGKYLAHAHSYNSSWLVARPRHASAYVSSTPHAEPT